MPLISEQLQEANARLEAELAEMELAPVQRKIEARSSDDSFTGLVRTLHFADTFLSDSELYHQTLNLAHTQQQKVTQSDNIVFNSHLLFFL